MGYTIRMNKLQIAACAGVASFLLSAAVFILYPFDETLVLIGPYAFLDAVGLIFYITYIYGFVLIARKYGNPLLEKASYANIILNVLATGGIYLLGLNGESFSFAFLGILIAVSMFVIGWQVLSKLQKALGPIGLWYGGLEIISAVGIVYWFVGTSAYIIDLALYLLGALLLYKASKK